MTNTSQQQQPVVLADDMFFLAIGEQAERQQNAIERGRALYNMREMSRAIQDLSSQNQALTNRLKELQPLVDGAAASPAPVVGAKPVRGASKV
jgi:hypothetical protein